MSQRSWANGPEDNNQIWPVQINVDLDPENEVIRVGPPWHRDIFFGGLSSGKHQQ